VRVARLGLDNSARAACRAGLARGPEPELVAGRLRILREFGWSSYPGYAGYTGPLPWVWREPLARLCGGKSHEAQGLAVPAYTEGAVLQGGVEPGQISPVDTMPWFRIRSPHAW
jgi:hypothetical protein